GREHSVAQHDDEDHVELQALRLMNGGEADFFFVTAFRGLLFGFDVGQERQLGEEILDGLELHGKAGQLFEVFAPGAVVGELLLQVILVSGFDDVPDDEGGASADGGGFQLRDGGGELRPGDGAPFWNGRGNFLQGDGEGEA